MRKMNKIEPQDTPPDTLVQVDSSDQKCSLLPPEGALEKTEPDTGPLPHGTGAGPEGEVGFGEPRKGVQGFQEEGALELGFVE